MRKKYINMIPKAWEQLPPEMKNESVRKYYDILQKRKGNLFLKRLFDIIMSSILLIILIPVFLIFAIVIKCDSKGPVFFKQERITKYGQKFKIYKLRTMVNNAETLGSQITADQDIRITKIGKFLRKTRLDETAQVLNVLNGSMTFVGTRPEVSKYKEKYTDEMMATLLLPAGITSLASIMYKDEEKLIYKNEKIDDIYINQVLPGKMKYNLYSIEHFTFKNELKIIFQTVMAVLFKGYKIKNANQIDALFDEIIGKAAL